MRRVTAVRAWVLLLLVPGCSLPRGVLGSASVDAAVTDTTTLDVGVIDGAMPDAAPSDDVGLRDAAPPDAAPDDVGTDTGPVCAPIAEACNLFDDDCDGRVDEAGCGCEMRTSGDHVYQLCPGATANDAWGRCTTLGPGYDLIVLDDMAEVDFLRGWTMAEPITIGLSDFVTEGAFTWADGHADTLDLFRAGEPGGHEFENCVFSADGTWFDIGCSAGARYVCEGVARTTPLPAGTAEVCNGRDDDLDGPIDEDVCPCPTRVFDHELYQLCPTPRMWADARSGCRSVGDYQMLTVETLGEAQGIGAIFGDTWTGLNDEATENRFVWESDPSTLVSMGNAARGGHFVNWSVGEPNDAGGTHAENCVIANGSGSWNDATCAALVRYVCERAIAP